MTIPTPRTIRRSRRPASRHRTPPPLATSTMPMPPPADFGDRRRWIALVVVCLAMFMNALDGSIVNVALPDI